MYIVWSDTSIHADFHVAYIHCWYAWPALEPETMLISAVSGATWEACWSLHFCFGWGMCDFISQWHSWRANVYPFSDVLPEIMLLFMGITAFLGYVDMRDHYCHLRSCWWLLYLLPMRACWWPRPILSLGWSILWQKSVLMSLVDAFTKCYRNVHILWCHTKPYWCL